MPQDHNDPHHPTENDVRDVLKALESSGVLKDVDSLSRDEGKRKLLEELSRQGLGKIHPDMLVCNNVHYFFIVKPLPPPQ
jgi:hypothetical protein